MFEQRLRRALSVSRERLAWVSGVKQELLDFFVRQGVSVAGQVVRVRQLDLCIDCKLCEEACEERYGARRLTLGGYQLGMLDFIYTCRTCTDQRCIDPCAYDSIRFDEDRREVVINESTCTGCTACAQACPYGAIDMIEVEPDAPTFKKDFKARLEKKQRARVRPRHAADRARPPDRQQVRSLHRVRRSGLRVGVPDRLADRDQPVRPVPRALAEDGAARAHRLRRRPDPARSPRGPAGDAVHRGRSRCARAASPRSSAAATRRSLMWMLGIFAFLLALGEVLLRLYAPTMSYQFSHPAGVAGLRGHRRRRRARERAVPRRRAAGDLLRPDRHGADDHRRDLSDLPADQAVPLAGVEHDVVRLPPDGRHGRADVRHPALGAAARHLGVGGVLEHGDRRGQRLPRPLPLHPGPGAVERRRARGARPRARVPEGAAAAHRADGRDRSRARDPSRPGAGGRDVAERDPRAVVADLPGHRPDPRDARAARPARAARRRPHARAGISRGAPLG